MKKFLLLSLLSFLTIQPISYSQSPTIQAILDDTNIDSLVYFVRELSGDVETIIGGSPYTIVSRNKNEPGNDKAADYIEEKLNSYGLTVHNQPFGSIGRNVYAVQQGTLYPDQYYIICAHYDDMPYGSIAPGADDNASGTAAVLEAARIFSRYSSDYTIIYALWDEEEQGLIGSNYYASQAASNGLNILGVVNMDMIAWDSDSDNIIDLHTRSVGTSIQLKDVAVAVNADYNLGLTVDIKNPGSTYSDHAAFWNNNFGAILIIEDGSDFNNFYHTVNDLVTHFNQPYYLKLAQLAFGTLATLAEISGTVPVELASFTGDLLGNIVELEWSTASETNNHGFEVQRSIGESNFRTIAFIQGAGTTTEINSYSYLDDPAINKQNIELRYRLKQVDYDGAFSYSEIINIDVNVPLEFVLQQNYPNPFNPSTKIEYSIPKDGLVNLTVYDLMGEEVAVLESTFKIAGTYEYNFNATDLPSGVYFYSLFTENNITTKKMILVK